MNSETGMRGQRERLDDIPHQDRLSSWLRMIFWISLFLVLFTVGAGLGLFAFLGGELRPPESKAGDWVVEPKPGERVNILVLGVDDVEGIERSDTIIVVSLDPITHEAAVLSIPRDTLVKIPDRPGREKIAHAHAYGGPGRTVATVNGFLGMPMHYYVKVDFEGFRQLVDILGGITVNIEKSMFYEDPYQDLYIDLKPGRQRLDGEKALHFVRYRNDGDLNRVRRQHEFLRAVADKAFSVGTVFKLPKMVKDLAEYVETNMLLKDMLALADLATGIDQTRIVTETIPVTSVWKKIEAKDIYLGEEADDPAVARLVNRLLKGIDREANGRVKVRVINSTGVPARGERLAQVLEGLGYKVGDIIEDQVIDYKGTAVVYDGNGEEYVKAQVMARNLAAEYETVEVLRPASFNGFAGATSEEEVLSGVDLLAVVSD